MLALPPINYDEYTGPVVVSSVCFINKAVEPAGRAFHEYAIHRVNYNKVEKASTKGKHSKRKAGDDSDSSDEEVMDAAAAKKRQAEYEKKRKAPGESSRLKSALEGENLYKLLKIDEGASNEEIRQAHRRACLMYHPDKAKSSEDPAVAKMTPDELKAKFLAVQNAMEILMNPATRRMYDSQIPFDESIPKEDELYVTPEAFFARFEEIFQRNARFSIRRPVPTLGGMNATDRELDKFYTFWRGFQSWRDFSIHDEFDLNDAEFREERRWMERKNKKAREKYELAEKQRIRNLIDLCERKDPRMIARKEKQEAERDAERKAKQDAFEAKRRAEQEAREAEERRKADEARREEERLAREKAEKEEYKARVKTYRGLIKKAHNWAMAAKVDGCPTFEEVQEEFTLIASADDLAVFVGEVSQAACLPPMPEFPDTLESIGLGLKEQQAVAQAFIAKVADKLAEKRAQAEEKRRQMDEQRRMIQERKAQEEAAKKAASEWTVDELSLLAKALVRFPAGVNRRWMMIADMLGTRTADEVVAKAREMQDTSKTLRAMSEKVNSNSFHLFQNHNPNALKKVAAGIDVRGNVGTSDLEMAYVDRPMEPEAPAAAPAAPTPAAAAAPAPAAVVPEGTDPSVLEWSKEQQAQLEKAMAKHPASLPPNERWTAIAAEVEGKTKKECAARFKYIKEMLAAKKAATAAVGK